MKRTKLRIVLIFAILLTILGINTIQVYAGHCKGQSNCGCGSGTNCATGTCYWYSGGGGCAGHRWDKVNKRYKYTEGSPTCTQSGSVVDVYEVTWDCTISFCTAWDRTEERERRVVSAKGHDWSSWTADNRSTHSRYCRQSCHNSSVDGSRTQTERHSYCCWHQNNDGYRHRICSVCGYDDKEPNTLTVHFNGNTSNTPYATNIPGTINTSFNHHVNLGTATRYGYNFMGWAGRSAWTNNRLKSGLASEIASLGGGNLYNTEHVTVTLYAQWERRVNYTFNYYNDLSHRADAAVITFIYHNDDTNKTLNVPNLKTVVDHNLSNDWALRGFSQDSGFEAVREYWPNDTINLPVKDNNGNLNPHRTFYASYKRTVKFEYVDYGDNQVYTDKKESKTAFLQFNGNEKNPTFKTQTIRNMSYSEPDSAGTKIKEKWTTRGWSHNAIPSYNVINENARKADASVGFSQSINITTNKDHLLYALYEKQTVTNLNPNGGVFTDNNASRIVNRRYASAYCKGNNNYNAPAPSTTKPEYTLPNVYYYGEGNLIKYTQGAWNHTKGLINQNFAPNMNITKDWNTHYPSGSVLRNNFTGIYNAKDTSSDADIWYRYYPLVNETLYATWTNQTEQVQALEPEVTVAKTAVWNNPAGDDSTVDYDALRNIDIDGIAKVTLTVNVKNKSGKQIKLQSFSVEDYFDTNKWDIVNASGQKETAGYAQVNANGKIVWSGLDNTYANGANNTYTFTYYLKLKEPFWTIDDTGKEVKDIIDYYINPMASGSNIKSTYTDGLNKYLASLNADGTMNRNDFNYCNTSYGHKSYCYVFYTIIGTELNGTQRYVAYPSDSVEMRPVNWRPTVSNSNGVGVGIESDTNNIYHHLWDGYYNTYFVKYDTHSNNNSSDSPYRIYMNSQVRRSYSFYQITNNIFDIRSQQSTQDLIDNYIGHNISSSTSWKKTAKDKLLSGFSAKDILGVNFVKSIRTPVTTEGYKYPYGAVTTYDTVYSTNQDGLRSSIYPFIRTTNTLDGREFETTREHADLVNKRLDIIIDATNPIITDDKRIRYKSADGSKEWTESDGYMDINLVDGNIDPMAKTHILTFKFNDEVSGVNSPLATNKDWIERINDNIQVTLINTDTGKVIFDHKTMSYDNNPIIKANYTDTATFNKTGNVQVTLNPENDDLLGHLQLTIKIIDNVTNYTEKVYDIYSFCLTGRITISDTLPDYAERNWTEFINGEMGKVYIEADGFVDRVDVNFGEKLTKASERELVKRHNISNDSIYSINGDYPYDDYQSVGYKDSANSELKYLPKAWQKVRWGWEDHELGGVKLTEAYLEVIKDTYIENDILNDNLADMVKRYQDMADGKEVSDVKENTYAIIKDTLYTYPIYNGNTIKSYVNSYKIDGTLIMDEVEYPEYVIIDGKTTVYIEYERVVIKPEKEVKEMDDTLEPDELNDVEEPDDAEELDNVDESIEPEDLKIVYKARIESQTAIGSQWVQTGDGVLRPFIHYFYMPLYAEVKSANDPHYVTLTAFKDSDKDFVHYVKVKLTFTNSENSLGYLQTIINDN